MLKRQFTINVPFVTKKSPWSFHCLNCTQKFSSDNEEMTHYYVWNYPEFGDPVSPYKHLMLCSVHCVHQMLNKKGIDLDEFNEGYNKLE